MSSNEAIVIEVVFDDNGKITDKTKNSIITAKFLAHHYRTLLNYDKFNIYLAHLTSDSSKVREYTEHDILSSVKRSIGSIADLRTPGTLSGCQFSKWLDEQDHDYVVLVKTQTANATGWVS